MYASCLWARKARQGVKGDTLHSGGSEDSGGPPGGQCSSRALPRGPQMCGLGVGGGLTIPRAVFPPPWYRQAGLVDSGSRAGLERGPGVGRKGGLIILGCIPGGLGRGRQEWELEVIREGGVPIPLAGCRWKTFFFLQLFLYIT